MSERAIRRLRELWGPLSFYTVGEVTARQPDDVAYIELRKPPIGTYANGEKMYNDIYRQDEVPGSENFRTLDDVPEQLRADARIVWKRFTATTREGISFSYDAYRELDFTYRVTLDFREPSRLPVLPAAAGARRPDLRDQASARQPGPGPRVLQR